MNDFHFLRPEWLIALIPWFVLLFFIYRHKNRSGNWRKICDSALLPFLFSDTQQNKPTLLLSWLSVIGLLGFVAMAGPVWEKVEQPVFEQESTLVIVLDLSQSMNATDIKPNRLIRARMKLIDLLQLRREGQTALIVYAGSAYTVTPLTDDTQTIISQIDFLDTSIMPNQGSRADIALNKALDLFKQSSVQRGHILFITDGIKHLSADQLSLPQDIQLSILGIGSQQGSPIPNGEQGFILDQQGEIVISQLDTAKLQSLTTAGKGIYQTLDHSDKDIENLMQLFTSQRVDLATQNKQFTADQWREFGPWLVIALLPFAALIFRRGMLIIVVIALPLTPDTSYALDQEYLWQSADQKGQALMQQGKPEAASKLFKNPEWKASAAYQADNYEQTIESLEGIENADALYNRANAFAQTQDYQQAIEHYKKSLALNKQNTDATYNMQQVEKLLEQQSKQDKKNPSSDDKQNKNPNPTQDKKSEENQPSSKQSSPDPQNSSPDSTEQPDQSASPQEKLEQKKSSKDDKDKTEEQSQKEKQPTQEKTNAEKQQESKKNEDEQHQQSDLQNELSDAELEQQQVKKQVLRQLPDNPSELWRRKFLYQYKRNTQPTQEPEPW